MGSLKSTAEIAARLEEQAASKKRDSRTRGFRPGEEDRADKNYKAMQLEKSGLTLSGRDIYSMTHVELDYYLRAQRLQCDPPGSSQELKNAYADFVQGTIKNDSTAFRI